MPATAPTTRRTDHVLALMAKGDELFNARDWEALEPIHHPDMIAHIPGKRRADLRTGSPRRGDEAARPDVSRHPRAHSVSDPFGDGDWITVVTNATGTFTGGMTLPDGIVIPPTGEAFDLEFAQTSKWDGDELIVISAFWDTARQAKQLGLPKYASRPGGSHESHLTRQDRPRRGHHLGRHHHPTHGARRRRNPVRGT